MDKLKSGGMDPRKEHLKPLRHCALSLELNRCLADKTLERKETFILRGVTALEKLSKGWARGAATGHNNRMKGVHIPSPILRQVCAEKNIKFRIKKGGQQGGGGSRATQGRGPSEGPKNCSKGEPMGHFSPFQTPSSKGWGAISQGELSPWRLSFKSRTPSLRMGGPRSRGYG